jgi:hypothetical protein
MSSNPFNKPFYRLIAFVKLMKLNFNLIGDSNEV